MLSDIQVEISGLPLVTAADWHMAQTAAAEDLPPVHSTNGGAQLRRRLGITEESEARSLLSKQYARSRMEQLGGQLGEAISESFPQNAHWQVLRVVWDGFRKRWLVEFAAGKSKIERVEVSTDLADRLTGMTTVQDKQELAALLEGTIGTLPAAQDEGGFAA